MAKRSYNRRSDEQLINDLQDQIKRVEARLQAKDRVDAPVLKEVPKVARTLRRFAQIATDHDRTDLSNMAIAFLSGLERAAMEMPQKTTKKSRSRRESAAV